MSLSFFISKLLCIFGAMRNAGVVSFAKITIEEREHSMLSSMLEARLSNVSVTLVHPVFRDPRRSYKLVQALISVKTGYRHEYVSVAKHGIAFLC